MEKIKKPANQNILCLVTGAHRSGTTWVGKTLETAKDVAYIQEPFNINNPFNFGYIPYWYYQIHPNTDEKIEDLFDNILSLKFRYFRAAKRISSFNSFARYIKYSKYNIVARKKSKKSRVIMKDPLALFSAGWLFERYNAKVLVIIRHPAAFVNSILRVGWSHPFSHFLSQTELLNSNLSIFSSEIREYSHSRKELIDQAILLWRITHYQIKKYKEEFGQDWLFVRHEDISMNPELVFKDIFNYMGLDLSDKTKKFLKSTTNTNNKGAANKTHDHKRDSKKVINIWKSSLSKKQIEHIRSKVEDISQSFYDDTDW